MASIGCERCGRTEPPLKYIKNWPPTQDIALFLYSSTRASMACQKENKKKLNQWLQHARLLLVKVKTFFVLEITLF